MNTEKIISIISTVIVLIITVFVPAYVSYDLSQRGNIPEKKVGYRQIGGIDPLRDLSPLSENVTLSINLGGKSINNLVVYKSYFKNIGKNPIVPTDFYKPLSVKVDDPWRIIAVVNDDFDSYVKPKWVRVSDNEYDAEPTLLNPQDEIAVSVYVTNKTISSYTKKTSYSDNLLKWDARVLNLPAFEKMKSSIDEVMDKMWGISVNLYGWKFVFVVICAPILFFFYIYYARKAVLLVDFGLRSYVIIVMMGMLSFAATESASTYLFGDFMSEITGVSHWYNLPPIILHMIFVVFLFYRIKYAKNIES